MRSILSEKPLAHGLIARLEADDPGPHQQNFYVLSVVKPGGEVAASVKAQLGAYNYGAELSVSPAGDGVAFTYGGRDEFEAESYGVMVFAVDSAGRLLLRHKEEREGGRINFDEATATWTEDGRAVVEWNKGTNTAQEPRRTEVVLWPKPAGG